MFEFDDGAPGMGMRNAMIVQENWISYVEYMTKHLDTGVFTLTMHLGLSEEGTGWKF